MTQSAPRSPLRPWMILTIGMSTWQTSRSATARWGSRLSLLLRLHLRPRLFLHPQPELCGRRPTEGFRRDPVRPREGRALHARLQARPVITHLRRLSPLPCALPSPVLPSWRPLCRILMLFRPLAPFPGLSTGPSRHRDRGPLQDPPIILAPTLRVSPQPPPLPPPPP